MEDKLLVLRCKRGSTEALGRIYEKYKTDMLVLAMALLNDKSAAEDVMHDVFLSFVMNIEKFSLTGNLKAYLLTCLANQARNLNKAKRQRNVELDEAELVRTNSTGLTIYNPSNLANLIKGMKNKNQTREQKIALRKQYEQSQLN